ncbi:MAG: hypothetical protein M0016_01275 [Deltaproteobacteria bacterium]|jgi:hypothetical protein|nr:hypothetical protein [Deltaproteobacteria bacterium]MCL5880835.1 hypothetical protein [Deltaproteobacteria bacterium]MDA8303781.1 hypothetical protein [Deltaproteobacteria bacterium]
MKIKNQLLKNLDSLNSSELMRVYEYVLELKQNKPEHLRPQGAYMDIRKALSSCKGALSDDIKSLRQDRI